MVELKEGLLLYHGSYCQVDNPSLEKCALGKDFGRGFYLTSSKAQAVKLLNISLAKAGVMGEIDKKQGYGFVSIYRLKDLEGINYHIFKDANVEWLHCVAAHRKKGIFSDVIDSMKEYDLICGKIADDATNATLTAYLAGAFGIVGEKDVDDFCIKQLLPNKLQDQLCFRTERALSSIEFISGEQIWLNR